MGNLPKGDFSASSVHNNMLGEVVGSAAAPIALLYSYKRSFNGFVAKLTEDQVQKMKGMMGVVSVFPSEKKQLHTTRSWDFIGFAPSVNRTTVESNVVVGMLDTGIWPESASFSDEGFGPPPIEWKGACTGTKNFTCNNKVIGARYYRSEGQEVSDGDIVSPRDSEGHGTHTASTAAGREVTDASLLGLATGTARGAVPSSRIAVYKICWSDGCADADILAAFDDAIADGVDIISLSVGGSFPLDYFEDPIAIGAFHAMKSGILTSNSAGNSGPNPSSISNFSPWSLSVAASTIDRKFVTKLGLGSGKVYEGVSVNTFTLSDKEYPLIYGGDAPANDSDGSESRYCYNGTLDKSLVTGKILLCDELSEGDGAVSAGAVGTVMADTRDSDLAFVFQLPATYLNVADGGNISKYINTTSNPTANIFKSVEAKDPLAPLTVSFSSRGPNPITPDILKPDITAPGVDILAAWSQGTTVTGSAVDTRVVPYNIISGTSMSCPHVTGAAAYVKSFNPTWSPAAIKSALMTTATIVRVGTPPDAEFGYGSGQINPVKAVTPGLIYDAGEVDYINMLCGQGYNTKSLRLLTGDNTTCSAANKGRVWDLNYPSFAFDATATLKSVKQTFNRTVTNVGSPGSVYKATITAPTGISIEVVPNVLSFKTMGEKQSFVVSLAGTLSVHMGSGSLVWDDGVYQVRSPIVVYAQPGSSNK
ncbi:hypothetical protein ACHQM5_020092 [Ranunculus cassubicifolius]